VNVIQRLFPLLWASAVVVVVVFAFAVFFFVADDFFLVTSGEVMRTTSFTLRILSPARTPTTITHRTKKK
jgi:hypothetical protein